MFANSQVLEDTTPTGQSSAPLFRPLPQSALRRNLVTSLLTAIFRGQLQEGDWLHAQRLAQQFGVSATPVRESLVELAGIGIVEMQHNRGTIVRPFGPVQVQDIYHLRRVLETEATRCACGRIPGEALARLKQEMAGLLGNQDSPDWSDQAMKSDCELHDLIAQHCGSQRLAEEIKRYNTLIQCIREVLGNRSSVQQRALTEHLAIIGPLLEGGAEAAAEAMARHIQNTAERVGRALFPNREPQGSESTR